MNKINNYEDLILERRRLESDLAHYKSIITSELDEIKHKMEPITDVVSFFTPSRNPPTNNSSKLIQAGANLGIELLVRQKLLSKAGWFTKLVLPFILKKVSSRAIEKVQEIRK
jgi:hypothetical protein